MKRKNILALIIVLVMLLPMLLTACDRTPKYDVTLYDGTTVLKVLKVKEGETLTLGTDGKTINGYTPAKEGYDFVNWFSTPSKNHRFDFTKTVTEDLGIYVGFTQFVADTRDYFVVGAGTSNALFTSSWGNGASAFDEDHQLEKAANKNEYTITLDLMENDEFQFVINKSWHNKRGYGYLATDKMPDGTAAFTGAGSGLGEVTSKGMNIKVVKSGNYTFTLKTYPGDDYYDTAAATYTEATKEVYNYGTYDTIEWVRNGEVVEVPVVDTNFYIKGSGISNWQNMYTPAHKFTKAADTYTLAVYLKAGEEFMFISTNTQLGMTTDGTKFLRYNLLDDDSKDLFTEGGGGNIVAKDTGTYTFVYDAQEEVLSATLDTETTPALRDYYLDGTFIGGWGDSLYGVAAEREVGSQGGNSYLFIPDYKLTETSVGSGIFQILGVTLPEGCEIIIQSYKRGAAEPGIWNTEGYNALGTYNYSYLFPASDAFEAVSATNNNIKIKTGGTYNIQFNSYTNTISIIDGYDVYIKGGMNGWAHSYSDDWKLAQNEENDELYEITLTFDKDWEMGLAKYSKGSKIAGDNGAWIGRADLGTSGDANSIFDPGSGNLKCSVAGTYRIVYNASTNKIDIYEVEED